MRCLAGRRFGTPREQRYGTYSRSILVVVVIEQVLRVVHLLHAGLGMFAAAVTVHTGRVRKSHRYLSLARILYSSQCCQGDKVRSVTDLPERLNRLNRSDRVSDLICTCLILWETVNVICVLDPSYRSNIPEQVPRVPRTGHGSTSTLITRNISPTNPTQGLGAWLVFTAR
jgi:hypothetical protein